MFSCEFCEISKNTFFFAEQLPWLLLSFTVTWLVYSWTYLECNKTNLNKTCHVTIWKKSTHSLAVQRNTTQLIFKSFSFRNCNSFSSSPFCFMPELILADATIKETLSTFAILVRSSSFCCPALINNPQMLIPVWMVSQSFWTCFFSSFSVSCSAWMLPLSFHLLLSVVVHVEPSGLPPIVA